jgi:GGDEF domain-containing protein
VPPTIEWGQTSGSDVLLVPISVEGREADWVLALVGSLPEDAGPQIATLGRIVGVHGELSRMRRRERIRQRFSDLVQQPGVSAEAVGQQVVSELVSTLNALGGALSLNRRGRIRSLASVGAISHEFAAYATPPGDWMFAPDQFVCAMPLARDVTATLELRPVAGDKFTTEAALTTRTAAEVLQSFLRGAEPTLADAPISGRDHEAVRSAFLDRIEEELERAKRFDLRLSLVLIDMPPQVATGESSLRVQEAVRRELRGSDVLGKMGGHRVAALLTHTDESGSHRVVERLRRRLAEGARAGVPGISIGHAVFSADCRTADALVAKAVRDAAPVVAL